MGPVTVPKDRRARKAIPDPNRSARGLPVTRVPLGPRIAIAGS